MSSFHKRNKLNSFILRHEKVKREITECNRAFYSQHKDKFTSPKHKLLAFLKKANTARGLDLLESRCDNFRHLQRACSSLAAVLLIFWNILLETILPIVLSKFLKYVLLSYSYRSKSQGLRTSREEQLKKYAG